MIKSIRVSNYRTNSSRQVQLLLKKIKLLEREIQQLKLKADYCDQVLLATNTMSTTEVAQSFHMSAQRLNKVLEKEGIIYKKGGNWYLSKPYLNKGYAVRASHLTKKDTNIGSYRTYSYLRWTQKGKKMIWDKFI